MLKHTLNYIYNLMMILGGSMLTFNRADIFWHLGCYASIVFGFMLRMNQIRKKQELTNSLVFWNITATICICWLGFKIWNIYSTPDSAWYQVFLFIVSFFAVIISENLDALGKVSIPELRRKLARKLYLPDDKEETE